MLDFDTDRAVSALHRARKADASIWSGDDAGLAHWRTKRNDAVRDAVDAGMPLEQIADDLGVLIVDVERMVASTATS